MSGPDRPPGEHRTAQQPAGRLPTDAGRRALPSAAASAGAGAGAHPIPAGRRLARIRSVTVFRALVLGDLLCATPALRAMRAGWPDARIALVGLPWARELAERLASVDDFIEFPGWPGLPERPLVDVAEASRFVARMRAERFDLAVQLHGSGGIVNPLVAGLGARHSAGFADAAAWRPDADAHLFAPWPVHGTEVERLLALTDHLGLRRRGEALDFPLRDADRREADRLLAPLRERSGAGAGGYAIVHAGSQLPSRRWPPERFAAVADRLAADGFDIVVTGTAGEVAVTAAVLTAMRAPALDLTGRTTLWSLGALVERAALVVCNDTGISHVAAALATPSVVVSSGGDARRWAPADASRHRELWQDMACRPCAHAVCPIGHGCALAVGVGDVLRALREVPQRRPAASPAALEVLGV